MSLSKGVYNTDDCGKIKSKDSIHTRRSKQNTYHVVNKKKPQVIYWWIEDKRGDAIRGIPKLRFLVVLEYYLGVPWAFPSLGSFHSLFRSTWKLHNTKLNRKLVRSVSEAKQITTFRYCCKLIPILYLCYIYCILTSSWFIPPDTTHRLIKISKQHNENRICQKQNSL